jgi:hypothetical protein
MRPVGSARNVAAESPVSRPAAVLALVTALLGTACASSPDPVWVKPGATAVEFQRDDAECGREATERGLGGGPQIGPGSRGAVGPRDLYALCMQGRGWTRRP